MLHNGNEVDTDSLLESLADMVAFLRGETDRAFSEGYKQAQADSAEKGSST